MFGVNNSGGFLVSSFSVYLKCADMCTRQPVASKCKHFIVLRAAYVANLL